MSHQQNALRPTMYDLCCAIGYSTAARIGRQPPNAREVARVMITDHQSTPSVDIENYVRRALTDPRILTIIAEHIGSHGPARTEEGELRLFGAETMASEIRDAVCATYRISITDLLSHCRASAITSTVPRHLTFMLCRLLTTRSYAAIGRFFNGRDHTSIMHACHKYAWLADALRAELTPSDLLDKWVGRAVVLLDDNAAHKNEMVQARSRRCDFRHDRPHA